MYRLFREIPENQKPRGKYLLVYNPNLSLYATFLRRRWESEGTDPSAGKVDLGELIHATKELVDSQWAQNWGAISRDVNTMMIATYGKSEAARKPVRELLEDFRRRQDDLWRDFENERDTAIRNSDKKRLRAVWAKCRDAFSKDTRDWRFKRSNDAKEWPCEIKKR